ncbi:MAG: hypothetical protein HY238_04620 [Acidobacteria bacterium]|nr:hypothetical protein [Acidobacteriota bacterium]
MQTYVPKLQSVGEVCIFLRWQRRFKIPSSAAFGKIGQEYVKAIYRFAEKHHIPVVHFQKGQKKEEVARPYDHGRRRGRRRPPTHTWSGAARCAFSDLALAQRPRVGQAAVGESRDWLITQDELKDDNIFLAAASEWEGNPAKLLVKGKVAGDQMKLTVEAEGGGWGTETVLKKAAD